MDSTTGGATIPGVAHHHVGVNGTTLHYVSAGTTGSPVLLVHGFPETWWVFHHLIPLLSAHHRVFAADLRGFGDSATATGAHDSVTAAQDLTELIALLDVGPVHLTGQDISGPTTFRVVADRPDLVRSYAAIETGLPGFGAESLADVTRGGVWHIGVLAAPGIPEMLLAGRERAFLAEYAIPSLCATPDAFTAGDIDELARSYARPDAFKGAAGLYRSLLRDGEEIRRLAAPKLTTPVLAVGGRSGEFTPATMRQVAEDVSTLSLDGIGHYAAMEAPTRLATGLRAFYAKLDTPR
ncbi:Pimeloyl-ACP methyl ester carboxylesterase [Actinacidiphila yanglinensis]|uniref:Pimeloyl-ACP methyl ester carboxylesterase n=1 Tax=Actinacidiphila yanglinensis TaxID=310779 RepID=A0A1H6E174_9ACTN|nr:alpha/beta hydrolase [Actinacidiphila yanglinensis]SEG90675.1 Pimeloyl-ACP methyl ester carboxylesterase [Actinacidiphila yanglinensis]